MLDTVVVKKCHAGGCYSLTLAVVEQIDGKECTGHYLAESERFSSRSTTAVVHGNDGNLDGTIVQVIKHNSTTRTVTVQHPEWGRCDVPMSLILPRVPVAFPDLNSQRELDLKNLISYPIVDKWPISDCLRVTAYWVDTMNQRKHTVTELSAVVTYMRTLDPLPELQQRQDLPIPYGGCCTLPASLHTNDWTSDSGAPPGLVFD